MPDAPPVTVIFGSSRRNGDTAKLLDAALGRAPAARIIDLSAHSVAPYDYEHRHHADDFLSIARTMTESPAIVFATPVYWNSMSAQMKTFIDRMTDLTEIEKPLGRALAGKTGFLVATGASPEPPPGFEAAFADTAGYFRMKWGGALLAASPGGGALPPEVIARAAAFGDHIAATAAAQQRQPRPLRELR